MAAETVTVLVPTTGRPAFLRTALESIAAQSAAARITHVLVSENAGDPASRAVATEFTGRLPIDYVLREPILPALSHASVLTDALPPDGFIAILHDDDWWAPQHLAASLERLEHHPEAAASYSGFFTVESESSELECDSNLMWWFGALFPKLTNDWLLQTPEIILSSLWGTPGRFSTLVARAHVYKKAAAVYQLGNPFDVDRLLTLELVRSGPIIFGPLPEAFIRRHPGQDVNRFTDPEVYRYLGSTTELLLSRSEEIQLDLRNAIRSRLQNCPNCALYNVLRSLSYPWCIESLISRQLAPPELVDYAGLRAPNAKNLNYFLGRLLPPVLLEFLQRTRNGKN